MSEKKEGFGAPTKYDPAFCDQVIELGKKGKSITQIAVTIGVVKQTVYNWMNEYPDFLDAITRAREESQAWFEEQGLKGIWGGKEFNAATWAKQVSCRFPDDYTDKVKHSGDEEAPLITRIERIIIDPNGKNPDTDS